jgi:EAL domain-containing protein (putative c-di-GMP-specific phosphodiesterase class I)
VIVETIQSFAARLGLRTIAEHVHSAGIQRVVEQLGVHFSQGYYVGEPAPAPASALQAARPCDVL